MTVMLIVLLLTGNSVSAQVIGEYPSAIACKSAATDWAKRATKDTRASLLCAERRAI